MGARLRHNAFQISKMRHDFDIMDGYILGTSDSHGGLGMVRAAEYGNYTMVKHRYGYSNGKGPPPLRTRYDSGEQQGPGPFPGLMKNLNGVNSTRYVTLKTTYSEGYTKYRMLVSRGFNVVYRLFWNQIISTIYTRWKFDRQLPKRWY